ncbi:hypothetical protein X727_23495 [Mesorhizobium sp. L103C119B0]|nr:hypothetical protein X727_23495 [Mesorhizobium sp. L103C119B0]
MRFAAVSWGESTRMVMVQRGKANNTLRWL